MFRMKVTEQFGEYKGISLRSVLKILTPTQQKIYNYMLDNVNKKFNFVTMCAEVLGLSKSALYKNFKKFNDTQFAIKLDTPPIFDGVYKKNTYFINPYFLLPHPVHRDHVAKMWNTIAGNPVLKDDEEDILDTCF